MSRTTITAHRLAAFSCPPTKDQTFLWDDKERSLAVRTTPQGKASFIFQSRYTKRTIRITIGRVGAWSISDAREKARELQRHIDNGQDPRVIKGERKEADRLIKQKSQADLTTIGELWKEYLNIRQGDWAPSTYQDHCKAGQLGGEPYKRGKGKITKQGPLACLMQLRVSQVTSTVVENLAERETKTRPTNLRLAIRMLRTFLRWIAEDKRADIDATIAHTSKLKRIMGKAQPKKDHLLREQLPLWFSHTQSIPNPVISLYLQCLLLTGARRSELLNLKWEDVDLHWRSITMKDKVEGNRSIPMTDYVAYLLSCLPKRNQWVFSSKQSKSGRLIEPTKAHNKVNSAMGIELTLHGLRRSFKSLSEWEEIPAGVIAQIMGHKPTAIAEKHYTQRPLDLLRMHHQRLENWMLLHAQISPPLKATPLIFPGA